MGGIEMLFGVGRSIVVRSLRDPSADQGNFPSLQRRFTFRHAGLTLFGRDHFQERALVRMRGDDGNPFRFAARKELLENRHLVATLGFGGLMTALAVGLEEWANLAVITHLLAANS